MMFSFENGTQNELPDLLSKHVFHVTHISLCLCSLNYTGLTLFFNFERHLLMIFHHPHKYRSQCDLKVDFVNNV